jgi:putative phage-type endonuclease
MDPYRTRRELYELKLGHLPEVEDNDRMAAGRHVEPAVATWYAEKYGVQLRQRHQQLTHPKYPWMTANVDRLIVGERAGLEIKCVDAMTYRYSGEWGPEGTDQLPERYLLQGIHYAILMNYPIWRFAVLIGGNRLAKYVVERDAELDELVVEGEHTFWQCLQNEEPPPFEDHPSTLALIKKLHPGTNGETIALPPESVHWHYTLVEATEKHKAYEEVVNGCKAHLLELLGDAAIGKVPGAGEYRRKVVERKGFTVGTTKYVDFRYSKPKGADNDE